MLMSAAVRAAATLLCLAAIAAGAAQAASPADQRLKRLLERANTPGSNETTPPETRLRLLAAGEAALARRDAGEAAQQFERAGMVRHEADAELGLIRAYMQAGEYRRALAFASHTAGAHPQSGAGSALYAWLLHIGGQARIAAQLLDNARARLPDDALLQATASLINAPLSAPAAGLLVPPARFAPYTTPPLLPQTAAVIASGVLIDSGRGVLTSAAALGDAREVWVRSGLGQTVGATWLRNVDDTGLAQLRLSDAISMPSLPALAARDPFPGSPAFAVEFPAIAGAVPGWPLLRVGFLGKPAGVAGAYHLGVAMPPANRGGPVFDASGRLIGIAVTNAVSGDRLILASKLRKAVAEYPHDGAQLAPAARMPVDEIYEHALKITVQVIVSR